MQINDAGLQIIKDSEGLRTRAYYDTGNVLTIGYGHTSAAGAPKVVKGMTITAAEAEEILRRDVAGAEKDVLDLVKVPLNENQFSALVSFVFNLGRVQVAESTLLRKLNAGADPASEFDRWIYDNGKPLEGLRKRRAKERALFEKPVTGAPRESARTRLQRELAALGVRVPRVLGEGDSTLRYADLTLNDDTHEVTKAGEIVELSPTEFNLLRYLMLNSGRVLSKAQILDHVWDYDFRGEAGIVESYISYLRRKIDTQGEPLIHTKRGVGYVLREPRE